MALRSIYGFTFLFFSLTFSNYLLAQSKKEDPAFEANKQFLQKNYKSALHIYQDLVKSDGNNPEYNLRYALCMLRTNVVKTNAYTYIEKYFASDKASNEYYIDLGIAYHHALKLDEAIKAFNKFIELNPKKKVDVEWANLYITQCNNAKELIKKPLDVSFENLGKKVNTEFADYYPFLPSNESFIVFTTRRPGNTGGVIDLDGYYTSEIYMSEWKKMAWTKSKSVNARLNTDYDEEVVGLSSDGTQMLVYIDHEDSFGDIYLSQYEKNSFGIAVDLGKVINTNKLETAASISSDGTTIVFASQRAEGKGSTDLWMSKKLPDGTWGVPVNIEELNTEFGEDFPKLADDGSYIMFASQGFNSMGGYDVFKADWDSVAQKFKKPVNIGYPVNTVDDDMTICIMENGRNAYLSAIREDSSGDLDIYRVIFNKVPPKLSVITANVTATGDTTKGGIDAEIIVNYLPTGIKQGDYKTYRNGKVAIALDAGKYEIVVNYNGYKPYKQEITIDNRNNFTELLPLAINLEPLYKTPPATPSKKENTAKDGKTTPKTPPKTAPKTAPKSAPSK